ncbi:MAG: hypothetical protein ISS50_03925 [Anaerolineae bacterium]|nr:hypothetical protein [Anaerolineae bacterium]
MGTRARSMRDLWDEERAWRKARRRMRRFAWRGFPMPPPVGAAVPPEAAPRQPAPLRRPAPPIEIETPYVSPLEEVALDTNIERAGVVDEVASDIDRAAELLRSLGKRSGERTT